MSIDTASAADRQSAALAELAQFPLLDALYGRRARRISLGSTIPDGPLAYESPHDPLPLSELERMLVLTSMAGTTGWHYSITRNATYAGHMANYAAGAAGRTFPSAAGFHTSELFFTDDSGTYMFPTRDAGALVDPAEEEITPELMLERHAERIVKLSDKRIEFPREEPYYEGHNTWCVNVPGSLLAIPVGDLAQHTLAGIMFLTQNGYCLTRRRERPRDPRDREVPRAGGRGRRLPAHVLRPVHAGRDHRRAGHQLLRRNARAPGNGARRLDVRRHRPLLDAGRLRRPGHPRARLPLRRGRALVRAEPDRPRGRVRGVLPAALPRHAAAVEALCERKFGAGGPHNADTPGAWSESALVRSSAQVHDERFRECVALQAQYMYDTFGKFPATIPSLMILNYLQAHHLDLDFYDQKLRPGSYLPTHARHMETWH